MINKYGVAWIYLNVSTTVCKGWKGISWFHRHHTTTQRFPLDAARSASKPKNQWQSMRRSCPWTCARLVCTLQLSCVQTHELASTILFMETSTCADIVWFCSRPLGLFALTWYLRISFATLAVFHSSKLLLAPFPIRKSLWPSTSVYEFWRQHNYFSFSCHATCEFSNKAIMCKLPGTILHVALSVRLVDDLTKCGARLAAMMMEGQVLSKDSTDSAKVDSFYDRAKALIAEVKQACDAGSTRIPKKTQPKKNVSARN